MPSRQTFTVAGPSFVVDHGNAVRDTGIQIDWAVVPAGFVDAATGKKRLPAGVAGGRTAGGKFAIRGTGGVAAADRLLATDANEGVSAEALSGYGTIREALVFEPLLPDSVAGVLPAAIKADLVAAGFKFEPYTDNSAS